MMILMIQLMKFHLSDAMKKNSRMKLEIQMMFLQANQIQILMQEEEEKEESLQL